MEDAPFGYVNSFKSHINVGFFHGAQLKDPTGLLEGSGKRMRHVKVKPERQINVAALNDLIDAAYVDIRSRIDADGPREIGSSRGPASGCPCHFSLQLRAR